MKNLAMAQLMAGTNTWDAQGHVMSGSNDIQTRKAIFGWMKEHEKTFFLPRQPVRPIGVYFSPKSRNYFAEEFIESYRGIMMLLLQSHLEFQIVTPRTLAGFPWRRADSAGRPLLEREGARILQLLRRSRKTLIVTGETGKYDETGAQRAVNPILKLKNRFPNCPGKAYYAALQKKWEPASFDTLRKTYLGQILEASRFQPEVQVDASALVSTQIARVDGKISVFLANFDGLKSKENAQQNPAQNVKITFPADGPHAIDFLPFLGEVQKIEGTFRDGKLSCELPAFEKGAVVWVE